MAGWVLFCYGTGMQLGCTVYPPVWRRFWVPHNLRDDCLFALWLNTEICFSNQKSGRQECLHKKKTTHQNCLSLLHWGWFFSTLKKTPYINVYRLYSLINFPPCPLVMQAELPESSEMLCFTTLSFAAVSCLPWSDFCMRSECPLIWKSLVGTLELRGNKKMKCNIPFSFSLPV